MTYEDFIEYEEMWGKSAASDLLLLCGPDSFNGSLVEYTELEERFGICDEED